MLVNPAAPYFQNVDLLITADCVPFAYANYHAEFLKGKSVVIGCPKLDDVEPYKEKLVDLFRVSNWTSRVPRTSSPWVNAQEVTPMSLLLRKSDIGVLKGTTGFNPWGTIVS